MGGHLSEGSIAEKMEDLLPKMGLIMSKGVTNMERKNIQINLMVLNST